MAKILTDKEVLDIVRKAVEGDVIDDSDAYQHFLEDLAEVVSGYFGGEPGKAGWDEVTREYFIAFHLNESVPEDGGVYADYDTEVSWEGGVERESVTA